MIWLIVVLSILAILGFTALTGAPYVPSRRKEIRKALTGLVKLNEKDVLVDLGSGDGVVLREAAKLGATAIGYELSPIFYLISRLLCLGNSKISIKLQNYWRVDFPAETSVVYTFGDARDIKKMYKKVEAQATRLGRTISFVSYAFSVPGVDKSAETGAYFLYKVKPLRKVKP